MVDPTLLDREYRRVLASFTAYCQAMKLSAEQCESLRYHEDKVMVWFMALATGAALGLGPFLSTYLGKLPNKSPLLVASLVAFAAAVLAGITYRLLLVKVAETDRLFVFAKTEAMNVLRLHPVVNAGGLAELKQAARDIIETKRQAHQTLLGRLTRLAKWANGSLYTSYASFFTGILCALITIVGGDELRRLVIPVGFVSFSLLLVGVILNAVGVGMIIWAQPAASPVFGFTAPGEAKMSPPLVLENPALFRWGLIVMVAGYGAQVIGMVVQLL